MLHNAWELARAAVGLDQLGFSRPAPFGEDLGGDDRRQYEGADGPMGHASSLAALRYQHVVRDRDRSGRPGAVGTGIGGLLRGPGGDEGMEPTGTAIEPGSLGHVWVTPTNSTAGSRHHKGP